MSNVPLDTRFIGISPDVNLYERKTSLLNAQTQPYTMQDIIDTAGGGGVTSVTKAQFDTLVSTDGLTPGAYYIISGVDTALYGGTTIIMQAATTNELALAGHGIFYNPKYLNSQATPNNGYGIWESTNTYTIGDDAIWGGKHWTNKTGSVGSSVNKYTLDSTNWDVVPFNSTDYNVEIDVIHYDYIHDMIVRRKDRWNNDVDGNFQVFTDYISPDGYGLGNPIKDFQWGNYPDDFNTNDFWYLGVQSNYVKDSYLDCLNFIGGYIFNNTLQQYSSIYDNVYTGNDCNIGWNTLSNSSNISFNTLGPSPSFIVSNTLNSSNITENVIISGGIDVNECSNGSEIRSNTINGTSDINRNKLDTQSDINGNTLNGSSRIESNNIIIESSISFNELGFTSLIIDNNLLEESSIISNTITTSTIEKNSLEILSGIDYSSFSNTSINFNRVISSTIGGNQVNSCNISSNNLNNSYLNLASGTTTLSTKNLSGLTMKNGSTNGVDLSSANIIYGNYTREIFRRQDGAIRLGYYNNSDVFTVVNINA
jgi:hypothetical protein